MTLDTTPLTAPVDPAELKEFLRKDRTVGPPLEGGSLEAWMVLLGLCGAGFALVMIFIGLVAEAFLDTLVLGVLPLIVALLLVAIGWRASERANQQYKMARYRFARFVQANGFVNEGRELDRKLPGILFTVGRSRVASPVLRREDGRFVEFSNYRYARARSDRYRWGYVAIKLNALLPNIVLDARGNNGLWGQSNLPVVLRPEQRQSLGAEFDEHFTLYCPAGYERDALYLFTPDIMARFIDNAAQVDVEIVDDWLFLYAKRPLVTTDPATWMWLMTTVDALNQKLDQWERWRDDKLPETSSAEPLPPLVTPPPAIAAGGRRLRQKRELLKGLLALFALVAVFVLEIVFVFSLAR